MTSAPKKHVRRNDAGFTFLELVAVLIILAIMTSAVVPMFHDSIVSLRREGAVEDVIATMQYAHERAILDSAEHRFCLDTEKQVYWVEGVAEFSKNGEAVFRPVSDASGKKRKLPESLEFERPKAQRNRDEDYYFVAFYPGGACDVAKVTLRSYDRRRRNTVTIETEGNLGSFKIDGLD